MSPFLNYPHWYLCFGQEIICDPIQYSILKQPTCIYFCNSVTICPEINEYLSFFYAQPTQCLYCGAQRAMLRTQALFYFVGSKAPLSKAVETLEIQNDYEYWHHSPTVSLSLLWNFQCLQIYICKMKIIYSYMRAAFSQQNSNHPRYSGRMGFTLVNDVLTKCSIFLSVYWYYQYFFLAAAILISM